MLSPSKAPLALVHSDLWGPSPVLSHFGFSYYVIFVDDYSIFPWLYHLKRKSVFFSSFLEFKTFVENQFSRKIKAFQSDGGGEFQALQPLFKQHGILHHISCPHSPKKNGTTKRNIVTLLKQPYLFFKHPPCHQNIGMKPPQQPFILLIVCLLHFST